MQQIGEAMNIAVIGLGTMGGRMAAALVEAGHHVTGHDLDEGARARARDSGVIVSWHGGEAWEGAQCVLLSLPGPAECRSATEAISENSGAVQVVVDLSTVDPETSRTCADLLKRKGVGFLDAPVLGRPPRCGQWTLPVGGAPEDLAVASAALAVLSTNVVPVGDVGAGSAVKLLNNLMFAVVNALSVEILDVAGPVGVDPRVFYATVADSGAATVSPLFREVCAKVLEQDFSPAFSIELLEKDNRLGMEMVRAAGRDLTFNASAADLIARALEAGLGAEDTAAVVKVLGASRSEPAASGTRA
jgi:3-hydroxyisobutyrate dehydrogenase